MKTLVVIAVLGSAIPGVSSAYSKPSEVDWNLPAASATGGRGDAYSDVESQFGTAMKIEASWNLPAASATGGRGDAYSDVDSVYRQFPDIKSIY